MPKVDGDRERAILYMIEARDIHARFVKRCGAGTISQAKQKLVGGATWHRRWVRRYNIAIKVMRGLDA